MADVNDLLNQYANSAPRPDPTLPSTAAIPAVVDQKKAEVSQASDAKKAAMGAMPTDYQMAAGNFTDQKAWNMSDLEKDIRFSPASQLLGKYGTARGSEMIRQRSSATGEVAQDYANDSRTPVDWALDNTKKVGSGLVGSLAGVVNWGVGAVSDKAGTKGAELIDQFNQYVDDSQSGELQAKRRLAEAGNFLDERDNRVQEQVDIENGATPLSAGLSRIGRDAVDAVSNATMDSSTFSDGMSQAVGSLLAAGPLAKSIKAVGSALIPTQLAAKAAAGGTATERALAAIGEKAPILASIGSMEGGGAYQQSTSDVMGKTHEELLSTSPMYKELIGEGKSQQEAKEAVANRTGLIAAAITAPLAAATGTLVSKFEGNPLAAATTRGALSAIGRETIEEGTQGVTGQFAQNFAKQQVVDENQSMTEGVGRQLGEGMLYGAGAAGLVQTPNLARNAARAGAQGTAAASKAAMDAVSAKVDAVRAGNENSGPASRDVILEAAPAAMSYADELEANLMSKLQDKVTQGQEVAPEEIEQAKTFAQSFRENLQFNPDDVRQSTLDALGDVSSRPEAAFKLMDMFDKEKDESKKASLALDMISVLSNVNSFVNENGETIGKEYGTDPDVKNYVDALQQLDQLMYDNPQRARALEEATAIFEDRGPEANAVEVTDQSSANDAVAIATAAPGSANLDTNNAVLYQASQGTIQLSPAQVTAINYSNALLQAAKATSDEAVKLGELSKSAEVSRNITTEKGAKGESALDYAQGIMSAYKGGEKDIAAARLGNLLNFTQSLQNKVAALNSHFEAGDPTASGVTYQTIKNGGRENSAWFDAPRGAFVQPANAKSVKNAQATHLDARFLADLYNGLVEAFPDLNAKHISAVPLVSDLLAPVDQVTAKYRSSNTGNSSKGQNATTSPEVTPQVKTPVSETVPDVKTPKVEAPTDTVVQEDVTPAKAEPVKAKEPAPAPVVEEEAAPVQEPESSPAAEPKLKGIDAIYPNLLKVGENGVNYFKRSFDVAKKQISRLTANESPLDTVTEALTDSAALTAVLGSEPRHKLTPAIAKAYKGVFLQAENTIDIANKAMQTYLNKKYSKDSNVTRRDLLLSGDSVKRKDGTDLTGDFYMRTYEGRALNIAEVVDGDLVFNRELIESAALAAQQYVLTLDDYIRNLDAKDVSAITTIPEESVNPQLITDMSNGLYRVALQDGLAQKIQQYWGLTNKRDGLIGEQQGILDAVAAQFIDALVETGQLVETTIDLTEADGLPPNPDGKPAKRQLILFNTVGMDESNPLSGYPTAIDDAVLVEPEQDFYVGEGAKIPVAQFQMRNRLVENTPEQKKAIAFEQATKHYANWMMGGFYKALGKDNHLKLFGAGDMSRQVWNKNHEKSLEGRNRGIAAAYDQAMVMLDQVQNVGENQGVPYWKVPISYAHNMSRVGRLQMLGKQSPQANKQMRALISPTYSTLDMSSETGVDFARFMRGIGQHLGVKVHKEMPDAMYAKVVKKLDGLKPSIDALANWQLGVDPDTAMNPTEAIPDEVVDLLISNFKETGNDLTPDALLSLMDYARYRENPDSRGEFETSVYLEADGVTNGPINAMNLFTRGGFKAAWVRNVAKGGVYFNKPGQTLNQHIADGDTNDLYSEAKDGTSQSISDLREKLTKSNPDKRAVQQLNHLLTAMSMFFGNDLSFDADTNTLTLERGIAKNPLTITIYGSGPRGIAAKLTSTMTEAIYERLSQAAQRQAVDKKLSLAEAMFDGPDAQRQYDKFTDSMSKLMGQSIFQKDGIYKVMGSAVSKNFISDPKEFTFRGEAIENIQSNMLSFFVEPMTKAIEQTVGKELLDTATLIRSSVQVQSLILEDVFKREVQDLMDRKAKEDPNYRRDDVMSREEMEGIYKKLEALSPFIDTGAQRFYIAGSTVSPIGASLGSTFAGKYRSDARIDGPGDAGVSGVPYMNIGTGDGYMMQLISNMEGAIQNTLKVFDGQNLPLDQIENGSRMANEAVWQTYQANPMKAISDSVAGVVDNVNVESLSDAAKEKIVKALYGKDVEVSDEVLKQGLASMKIKLNRTQLSIEARHYATAQLPVSIDQMAGAMSPYQHAGTVNEELDTPEKVAAHLDAIYVTKFKELTEAKTADTASLGSAIDEVAFQDESGAKILRPLDLKNLAKLVNLPGEQNTVFNQIVNGLSLKGFTVIYGNAQQLVDYSTTSGRRAPEFNEGTNGEIHGATVMAEKTVYLIDPSSETLVHELIHASTFDTVTNFYGDAGFAKSNPQGAAAVKRIETLMDQFLAMRDNLSGSLDLELQQAYDDAYNAITGYTGNDPVSRASALNEFMAWSLSNARLTGLLKQTQANPLARIAAQVVALIKQMFSRTRLLPDPKQDMFSNLLFNSSMLMVSNPRLTKRMANAVLYQSSTYGNNDRLTSVGENFQAIVGQFLNADESLGKSYSRDQNSDAIVSAGYAADLYRARGFNMNGQESFVFNNILTALATEAAIDSNAMAGAQQMYAHALATLKPSDFIDPNDNDQQRAEYNANQQYNVLFGNWGTVIDGLGRSSLLPAFIALATVHDGFRQILSNMPMPKALQNTASGPDAFLENWGNRVMDSLGSRLAGVSGQPQNVQAALDQMTRQMTKAVTDQQNIVETTADKANNYADKANDLVVAGLTTASNYTYDAAGLIKSGTNNRFVKLGASVIQGFSALVNNEKAEIAAEGILAAANASAIWGPAKKFIQDAIGRVPSNASVYDMIKTTRALVQKVRQQFREDLPATLKKKFSRKLTEAEWTTSYRVLGRTDAASLISSMNEDRAVELLTKDKALKAEVAKREAELRAFDQKNFPLLQKKMKQLATFMNTGRPGTNLLRNAEAISKFLGETKGTPFQTHNAQTVEAIDHLTTLYAVESLSQQDKDTFASLVQSEAEGMKFVLSYMVGQRAEELRKSEGSDLARLNGYKGYIPTQAVSGTSLLVADNSERAKLLSMSYVPVDDYNGSSADPYTGRGQKSYFYAPVQARAAFEQGIMQNVRQSASGVDSTTGITMAPTAGVITEAATIKKLLPGLKNEKGSEPLMPVYDANGNVVALERSMNPDIVNKVATDGNLADVIGVWRGRQAEEALAQTFNEALIDNLKGMLDQTIKTKGKSGLNEYVDLWKSPDTVIQDSLKLMNRETRDYLKEKMGSEFLVRSDMLDDAIGYRSATIGDAWTGNSRWDPKTQETVKKLAISVFGNQAYQKFVNGEKIIQNIVSDAKVLIVVKSVVVPMANIISNMYQLVSRAVPLTMIAKGMPAKTAELTSYIKSELRMKELEAELRASTNNPNATLKFNAELQSIKDANKRLSIWPLIEAGEFSSVSDVGLTREDISLTEGRLQAYMEQLVNKLPPALANVGRYGLVTKDTALFQGMQKAVEYGDFLAKAIYFDHLTKNKKMTQAEAMGRITEEFVNYDRLSGRFRGYLESIGMLWFYNFKIRIMKIAASTIRNNPVHALLATLAPAPSLFGSVGLPMTDSLINKLMDGSIEYSVGPTQGLSAAGLNPWVNLVN
uniref:RNA polymerase n=1 Tax=Pseudomonas phage Arace01 TaxID=3138526 RepID=A0AAU6W029_9VIRU